MSPVVKLVLGVVVIVAGITGFLSVYTVHQAEQALVLEFGEVASVEREPGLHFKVPWQNVVYFDRRVLDFNNPAEEVPTLDQKQVVVNSFARYRIVDPLRFFQTVTTEQGMQNRLQTIINTNLRNVLGAVPLSTIMTETRADLMRTIAEQGNQQGQRFGIEVLDVRISRIDLPQENSLAIFRRMQTQREQEARRIRAEGDRENRQITAEADKQSRIIVAEGNRQSEILRGEGDGQAQAIYNDAYGRDPAFFDFYVTMNAYREGLSGESTRFVGPPDGDFFRFFGDMEGLGGGGR